MREANALVSLCLCRSSSLTFIYDILFILTRGVYRIFQPMLDRVPILFGSRREKTCLRGFANNTAADQPAYPRSQISAFVIRFLESIICKLATSEIAIF